VGEKRVSHIEIGKEMPSWDRGLQEFLLLCYLKSVQEEELHVVVLRVEFLDCRFLESQERMRHEETLLDLTLELPAVDEALGHRF